MLVQDTISKYVVVAVCKHTLPGNRSDMMPANSGRSISRNLGRLTSCSALSSSTISSASVSSVAVDVVCSAVYH
eukprot:1898-Heterococcus_DN1.PRE.1